MLHRKYPSEKSQNSNLKFTDRYHCWGGLNDEDSDDLRSFFEDSQTKSRDLEENEKIVLLVEQQSNLGNSWFSERIYPQALEKLFALDPSLIEQWIAPIVSGSESAYYLKLSSSFYSSVCETLFGLEGYEAEALSLYQKLKGPDTFVRVKDQNTEIELIDYAFFKARPSESLKSKWRSTLQSVKTDVDLLQVITLAWYGSGKNWLQSEVNTLVESSVIFDNILAARMLAFMPVEESFNELNSRIENQSESWIRRFFVRSKELWERNSFSFYWFQQFLQADEDLQAWAAFRIFLSCVDSRFWHWLPDFEICLSAKPIRHEFFKDNIDTIKNRIRKNEKPLREQYLGHKVLQSEVWPWM